MKDQIILAEGVVRSADCRQTGVNNNMLVIGGTGSGKTMSIVEPNLLSDSAFSQVIPVTKRRIVEKYGTLHRGMGTAVYDLDFAHPAQSSIGYDPLAYVRTDRDIHFLAESLIYTAAGQRENIKVDPFFDKAAASLLCAEIGAVKKLFPNPTFADVLDLHSKLKIGEDGALIETTLDSLFEKLEKREPESYTVTCWKSFRQLPARTAGCVYTSLNINLDKIFSEDMKKLMRKRIKVDFRDLGRRKCMLFVTTSPVNASLHSFTGIFYAQLFKELFDYSQEFSDGRLPVPVRVICDDGATGAKIPDLDERISIFREAGICIWMLIQSESQLTAMYGENKAVTIINNCDTIAFFGCMDLQTAENISRRADLFRSDVLYMPVGQVIIFRRGERPIITKRYNIMADKRWRQLNDMDKEATCA